MSSSRNLAASRLFYLLVIIIILLLSIIIKNAIQHRSIVPGARTTGVVRIIDGDTYVDAQGGRVRLLGIDTPEKGEPYYEEAKTELAQLIQGKPLRVELGPRSNDRYGRELAFVFADDTLFVNARLVEDGLARTYFFEENMSGSAYTDRLCKAQQRALGRKQGVWSLKPAKVADRYFGNPRTMRFHLPWCNSVESSDTSTLIRSESRDFFLTNCYSPCRNCKP